MQLLLNQYQSLLELSRCESLHNGEYEAFIREAVLNLSNVLNVSRVSFWSYDDEEEYIYNELMYDQNANKFSFGEVLKKTDFPSYFQAFKTDLYINASNATTDPRTREFKDVYLNLYDIKSMLDTQVSVQGKLFGVICMEQTGEVRNWKAEDELYASSVASYLAQAYILKLKNDEELRREQSEINYKSLFLDSPIPMWVYDHQSYRFLAANNTAQKQYGYTIEEFNEMTIFDIQPPDEVEKLRSFLNNKNPEKWRNSNWQHRLKSGEVIDVALASDWTIYQGEKARIVIAHNITEERNLQRQVEANLKKFQEFAYYASHNLRGPVSRLLGLNAILDNERKNKKDFDHLLDNIHGTISEIDEMIKTLNAMLDK